MHEKKVLLQTRLEKNCIRCGTCCHVGLLLTHEDVRRINEFLETISYDTWKQFAYDSWSVFQPHLFNVPDIEKKVEELIEIIKNKFHAISIYQLSENDQNLVFGLNHSLSAAHQTTCRFFNPLTSDCLIYPVRPDICRLYPYLVSYSDSKNKITLSLDAGCPGEGTPMTEKFQKELIKLAYRRVQRMRRYYAKLYNYIHGTYPKEKKLLSAVLDGLHGFEGVSEKTAKKSAQRLLSVFQKGKHVGSNSLYEQITSKKAKIIDLFSETHNAHSS